jgi:Flp pilus assembly protein TadD
LQQLLAQAQATASERPAMQEAPRDPGAAKKLQDQADAARTQGDLTSAIRLYGEAIAVSPPNTALYYLRGTARLEFGDRSGAATDFEAGLKLDPKNTTLQQLLAQAQATPSERPAVQEAPRDPGAAKKLQDQADAARAQGDLTSAIRLYGEAIALSPPNTALYYLRGTARLEFGDRSGAVSDFEAGLKLDPTNPALQQLLAQAQAADSRQGQQ